jgi:CheY-like chemotaxis protein
LTIVGKDANDIGMEHARYGHTTIRVGHSTRLELDGVPTNLTPQRVLLLEPDFAARQSVRRQLEHLANVELVVTDEGPTAEDHCRAGQFDVVLVAFSPDHHGHVRLLETLGQLHPQPVVVALAYGGLDLPEISEDNSIIWRVTQAPLSRMKAVALVTQACCEAQWRTCHGLTPLLSSNRHESGSLGEAGESPPRTQIAQYRVVEHLGTSPKGVVYGGIDVHADSAIVLRALPRQLVERVGARRHWWQRFTAEADAALDINHPNLSALLDYGLEADDQCLFLVAERAEGHTLAQRLRQGPLPPHQALAMAAKLCGALATIHGQNQVHGMISCANVFLNEAMAPTLTDVGLSSCLGWDLLPLEERLRLPGYLSPEQVRFNRPDDRSDQFALGLVLYEALTGCSCVPGQSPAAYVHAITRRKLNINLPPALAGQKLLQQTLGRMLAADRELRFHDNEELRQSLEQCRKTLPH